MNTRFIDTFFPSGLGPLEISPEVLALAEKVKQELIATPVSSPDTAHRSPWHDHWRLV
jgi:hypothetical protein